MISTKIKENLPTLFSKKKGSIGAKNFWFGKRVWVLLPLLFLSFLCSAQKSNAEITVSLLSKSISQSEFWTESSIDWKSLPKLYILEHGDTLSIPDNFFIEGVPIEVIQKNQLPLIGDNPVILVHTLSFDDSKALLRLYLEYEKEGQRKTSNSSFSYDYKGFDWVLN